MFPLTKESMEAAIRKLSIIDLSTATIRQICSLANELEKVAGETMVHLEIGNPGLIAERCGVEAEINALRNGIANEYPNISGIPMLKKSGSDFVKAFINIDIPEKCIVPTVGSMQGSFTVMMLLGQRIKGKDTMLFINPGFSAQRHQAKLLGLNIVSFDIYSYRGEKLRDKLENILKEGNITGIIYSNPNNPAWINLTEVELKIIGELATKYDAIVLEDLAYFGMDYRNEYGKPYKFPYIPTVANYTDNYILLISGSKIFSYAGQRIALVCMSNAVFERRYKLLEEFYEIPTFGDAFIYGVLYCSSSGTAHSAQYAMAAMMQAAVRGELDFIGHCKEYADKSKRVKRIFLENGFHVVYERDGEQLISDGFFFTAGYKHMNGCELQKELLRYGIASISLQSAGSSMDGIRVCVSMISNEESYGKLERFLKKFNEDH